MATKFSASSWEAFIEGKISEIEDDNETTNIMPTTISEIYCEARQKGIQTEPINIKKVITDIFGIDVIKADLDRNISGFIERLGEKNWGIYVNQYENPKRQKFTMAHELGHFIRHKNILLAGSHADQILFRDDKNSTIEMEASSFAANLLMPEDKFAEYIAQGNNTIEKLAEKFDLSETAVRYRAYKLGYISEF